MFVFGVGALVVAAWLALLAREDYLGSKPDTFKEWASCATLWAGIACVAVVAIRAFF